MGKAREWILAIGCIALAASLITLAFSAFREAELEHVQSVEQPAEPAPPVVLMPPAPAGSVPVKVPVAQSPQIWFTADDYPAEALRNSWQGKVGIEYQIEADGRVRNCQVMKSSGYAVLDEASCALMIRRARFSPALDANGVPVPMKGVRRIVWRLPDE